VVETIEQLLAAAETISEAIAVGVDVESFPEGP